MHCDRFIQNMRKTSISYTGLGHKNCLFLGKHFGFNIRNIIRQVHCKAKKVKFSFQIGGSFFGLSPEKLVLILLYLISESKIEKGEWWFLFFLPVIHNESGYGLGRDRTSPPFTWYSRKEKLRLKSVLAILFLFSRGGFSPNFYFIQFVAKMTENDVFADLHATFIFA